MDERTDVDTNIIFKIHVRMYMYVGIFAKNFIHLSTPINKYVLRIPRELLRKDITRLCKYVRKYILISDSKVLFVRYVPYSTVQQDHFSIFSYMI